MRIRGFTKIINKHLQKSTLKNSTVVIDGLNYFHDLYRVSEIPYIWGPESNKFANYLKTHLKKFQEANIKCYFVFHGGNENIDLKELCMEHRGSDIKIKPRFMKHICMEVLDELGFHYVVSEKQFKTECIALAQALSCPIISFDIEFCFSGVGYIPYKYNRDISLIAYNEKSHSLDCKLFRLNDFLKTRCISKEMLSIFIILTNEKGFNTEMFLKFFKDLNIPFMHFSRNELLLSWLSSNTAVSATKAIFKHLTTQNQCEFLNAKQSILNTMECIMKPGIPSLYLINNKKLNITKMDPHWFQKGVALNHIPRVFIDIYNFQAATISINSNSKICHPEDNTDSKISHYICLDIIKYGFDLLTNFCGASIHLKFLNCCKVKNGNRDIVISNSISKPKYFANTCVFENGWENITKFQLFHHFLLKTLPGFDFSTLNKAPESAQLLIIALVYFMCKNSKNSINIDFEVSGIMLSYILLRFVSPPKGKWTLIPDQDCRVARSALNKYVSGIKGSHLENGLCFCFYEFQDCLDQLNNLNKLCGKPFVPTIYSLTYNATFVYNCTAKKLSKFKITEILSKAPTVLELYFDLMQIYEEILNNISYKQVA